MRIAWDQSGDLDLPASFRTGRDGLFSRFIGNALGSCLDCDSSSFPMLAVALMEILPRSLLKSLPSPWKIILQRQAANRMPRSFFWMLNQYIRSSAINLLRHSMKPSKHIGVRLVQVAIHICSIVLKCNLANNGWF